jgi:hypothetical protein
MHDRLRAVIEQTKMQEIYGKYVEEARESTYVENRLAAES